MSASAPDFQELFEQAPAPYLVLDPQLTIVSVNDAYLRATMTKRADILGRPLFEIFPDNPEEEAASGVGNLRASLGRVLQLAQPDTMAVQKYDIRTPDGVFEERHWSPINTPVLRDGKVVYIIHRVEDVTDFARMQTRVSALESNMPGPEITHLERELFHRARELQGTNETLREQHRELQYRAERTEEQLRQAQKLEAVGRLSAGIAHDFNNLLSVICGYAEELLEDSATDAPEHEALAEIKLAGGRAADLVKQLLVFSRQQVLAPQIVDLNGLLENLGRMLGRLLGEHVELAVVPGKDLGKVKADPSQMEQVLINLIVNARDAMPNGGKLTIETRNVYLDESYAAEHFSVEPGPHVLLSVSDTGIGMDRATRDRIFEPFFTTKAPGQGSGLGLSTVFGIVKQSHGSVWVYSEPAHGSTFKIYLPQVDGLRVSLPPQFAQQRGTETILLVEDETQVRTIAKRTLERAGYAVLSASGPKEALELCEMTRGHIDLMLTDVVMPHMNGRELAERVRSLRPTLKVLFMSGYTDDAILRHGVLDEGVPFLQKPIFPSNLTRKVRETLDAP